MIWQSKSLYLKALIHTSALSLLIFQYYLAITDQLGGDPVEAIIHFTGIGAFNILLLTLLVSPLAKRFKLPWLMKSRRLLGLYAFTYALCHVLNFWAFEIQFEINLFFAELIKRPYITVGLTAFIILTALAVTSFAKVQRAMGKHWQTLHSFVYLALLCIAVHFYWSVKSEVIEPSLYILASVILLSWRQKKIKMWLKSFKK
ncbi:MAG: protein-methionine-sulfoxide reductase heme-binding subunit MsrQ [Thalassotalea sp.]